MTLTNRGLARIGFGMLVAGILLVCVVLAVFSHWRTKKLAALRAGSEVVQTSAGAVEYASRGSGPPVLVFHGEVGGYDQALVLGAFLADAGFKVIAPSRPGYLRTPQIAGLLPEQQADAMAALLDYLQIGKAGVIGFSAGGPAAVEFARRHPDRTTALVLDAAVFFRMKSWEKLGVTAPGRELLKNLSGDIGTWYCSGMAAIAPGKMLASAIDLTSDSYLSEQQTLARYVLKNPGQLAWFRGLVDSFAPLTPRDEGTRNDLLQIYGLPDQGIFPDKSVPTLIVYGTADRLMPRDVVELMGKRIPNAELYPAEGAGHLVQLGPRADETAKKIIDFLRAHGEGAGTAQP